VNLTPFVLALSRWSAPSPNGFSEAMRLGAFRALDALGLVEIDQNGGAFVGKIDLDEAIEIHDVCSALEELAARSAACRLSGTQIGELRSLVKSMEAAAAAEELDRYYSLNVGFHKRFMEGSGNRRLLRVYNRCSMNFISFLALARRSEEKCNVAIASITRFSTRSSRVSRKEQRRRCGVTPMNDAARCY
jgi:DNA-binding GntR family transcriptional regulator